MTNVPQPTFGANGFIIPEESAILTGVQADQAAAFAISGYVLNPALSTAQGQLATSEAAIIAEADATFLYYTTQTDPAYAEGRMQDAIGRIYFLERNPAQPTVVQALCSGAVGVIIPTGALAVAGDGNIYTCTGGGVIGIAGTVTLPFACNVTGPIACPSGALSTIYQAIPGWDSITNSADGVLGNNVEGRAAFEARRQASVAGNGAGSLPSIRGAVLAVPGVLDAYVTENSTGSTVTVGDYTLAAHSLYVAVAGGAPAAVAQAIWSKKAPGCAYNGNTSVVMYDTNSGYTEPYPSYTVLYETPADLQVLFAISIANTSQVPSNAAALIQNAILSAFSGGDGGARAAIAGTLYATRYIPPLTALGAWAQVVSIQIGSLNTPSATFIGSLSGTNLTAHAVSSGTLAVGQAIIDAASRVASGTYIVSQTSGTPGGAGVYVVSISQSVSGATFTGTGSGTTLTVSAVAGAITVGDTVVGTGVPSNTTIVSQTSGTTGGAGVYVTSASTTASSSSLTAYEVMFGVTANQNSVSAYIDQIPVVSAAQIVVTV